MEAGRGYRALFGLEEMETKAMYRSANELTKDLRLGPPSRKLLCQQFLLPREDANANVHYGVLRGMIYKAVDRGK